MTGNRQLRPSRQTGNRPWTPTHSTNHKGRAYKALPFPYGAYMKSPLDRLYSVEHATAFAGYGFIPALCNPCLYKRYLALFIALNVSTRKALPM